MASWIWAVDGNSDIGGGTAGLVAKIKTKMITGCLPTEYLVDYMASVIVYSVPDMVDKVLMAAGKDQISRLIIYGHGASGLQSVGCGQAHKAGKNCDYLAMDFSTGKLCNNADDFILRLKPKFKAGTLLSLGGCNVGASPEGRPLLKYLAGLLNVQVEAAFLEQTAFSPGFDGPIIRCGSSTCVIES